MLGVARSKTKTIKRKAITISKLSSSDFKNKVPKLIWTRTLIIENVVYSGAFLHFFAGLVVGQWADTFY